MPRSRNSDNSGAARTQRLKGISAVKSPIPQNSNGTSSAAMDTIVGKSLCCANTFIITGGSPMVLSIRIPINESTTIELPINFGQNGDSVTINWGDGTIQTYTSKPVSHTYFSGLAGRSLRAYVGVDQGPTTSGYSAITSAKDVAEAAAYLTTEAETYLANLIIQNPGVNYGPSTALLQAARGSADQAGELAIAAEKATTPSNAMTLSAGAHTSTADTVSKIGSMFTGLGKTDIGGGYNDDRKAYNDLATLYRSASIDADVQSSGAVSAGLTAGAAVSNSIAVVPITISTISSSITYAANTDGSITSGADNIIEATSFGNGGMKIGNGAFKNTSITRPPAFVPVGIITTGESLFDSTPYLTQPPLSGWANAVKDLANVKGMFNNSDAFNVGLGAWELAQPLVNVTAMLGGTKVVATGNQKLLILSTAIGRNNLTSKLFSVVVTTDTPGASAYIVYNGNSTFEYVFSGDYTIKAIVSPSYTFTGWIITSGYGGISDVTRSETTLTVNDNSVTVQATFSYSVTMINSVITVDGNQGGTVLVKGGIYAIEVVIPNLSGYTFDHWSINGGGSIDNINNPLANLTVNGNVTVTANYKTYRVTMINSRIYANDQYNDNTTVTVTGSGPFYITALTPTEGGMFTTWSISGTGTIAGTNAVTSLTNVTSDVTVTANFTLSPVPINPTPVILIPNL